MKFEDIKFYEQSGSKESVLGLRLPGGYWVQKQHFMEAWSMICAAYPPGGWRGKQTAETLCNDPGWNDRKHINRHKLGRCVKYFVVQEMLALKEANKGRGGPRKYDPVKP